jgi:hypothetical protein
MHIMSSDRNKGLSRAVELAPASTLRPGGDSVDGDREFRKLRPVEERVASVRQHVAFDFRPCGDETARIIACMHSCYSPALPFGRWEVVGVLFAGSR